MGDYDETEALLDRAAEVLGWTPAQVRQFSIPTTRDLLRAGGKASWKRMALAREFDALIRSGKHLVGAGEPE